MSNLDKLARIEERHAELGDGVRSLFARYRARADGARDKCRLALVGAADERIQCKALPGLAEYTNEQLKRYGVDIELLESARREQHTASLLFADYEERKQEWNASAGLLRSLQQYAGVEA